MSIRLLQGRSGRLTLVVAVATTLATLAAAVGTPLYLQHRASA
jgi:hypothetical protein